MVGNQRRFSMRTMIQTHVWNSPLNIGLQGEGAQELIYTCLNLHLIHVGH